jgi:hypothetical protein
MSAAATIAAIGATQCRELVTPEMPAARAAMAAAAENANLVYEITFLQNCTFTSWVQIYLNKAQTIFMKYLLLVLALPMLAATDCGKKKTKTASGENSTTDSLPSCLRHMIDSAKNDTPPTVPLQVDEYRHAGKTVYYVTADCCDFYNIVYDASCNYICAPNGGFTGKGDGKCPDFFKEATMVRTVWKKEEKKGQ